VANKHREIIYGERRKILSGADLRANIQELVSTEIRDLVYQYLTGEDLEMWDIPGLRDALERIFPLPASLNAETLSQGSREEAAEALQLYADRLYQQREDELTPETMRVLERMVMLRTIDIHWVEHLTSMENLRQGIGLLGIAQRDPLVAYKVQGHSMFDELNHRIQRDIVRTIYHVSVRKEGQSPQQAVAPSREQKQMAALVGSRDGQTSVATKVGRNDPCPCGSGQKYKKCHGG